MIKQECFYLFQVFYYFYAIIGMEIFNNKIQYFGYNESMQLENHRYCGNPALKGSLFYKSQYCSNNFNDLLKSIVLLFELTVVNQWHDILYGELTKLYVMFDEQLSFKLFCKQCLFK